MKLSILVPMENRHAFHPWLAWNLMKQTLPSDCEVEVLVCCPLDEFVDYTRAYIGVPIGTHWERMERGLFSHRHVPSELGEGIAVKRNKLLNAAIGDFIGWMDSDDWHAPDRFARALARLQEADRPRAVGFSGIRYLDITGTIGVAEGAWSSATWCHLPVWRAPDFVPITVVASRDSNARGGITMATPLPRFDETLKHGSDTKWARELKHREAEDPRGWRIAVDNADTEGVVRFFALYHGSNMSSRHLKDFRYTRPLPELIQMCGAVGWGDTTTHLQNLHRRLIEEQRKKG